MKEEQIRPKPLFQEYLRLSAADADTCFGDVARDEVACPGCGASQGRPAFDKHGFSFQLCGGCETLYVSPRPPREAFDAFYQDSESTRYWANVFLPAVLEARREKIFRPRVERIRDIWFSANDAPPGTLLEVGAGHGIFLEEWKAQIPDCRLLAVEPGRPLAEVLTEKGFETLVATAEDAGEWAGRGNLVVCFEVIEHIHGLPAFVRSLYDLTAPGGTLVITGLNGDGFDIQTLWDASPSVSPPHHINFLSRAGLYELFEGCGFDDVSVETPGQLDVDIVRNVLAEQPQLAERLGRFERLLVEDSEQVRSEFQRFLAEAGLSSHTWVTARRPAGGPAAA